MDSKLLKHVESAAETHASGSWMTMPSGAGHDAQTIAQVLPSAMLFVPSIEGKSHVFDENTSDEDLALGEGLKRLDHALASGKPWYVAIGVHRPHVETRLPPGWWGTERYPDKASVLPPALTIRSE